MKQENIISDISHKTEEVAKKEMRGFLNFIEGQNVVGIAVGLAVGAAASTLATSVVNNLILDPVGYIFGSSDGLRGLLISFPAQGTKPAFDFKYGAVLDDAINFLVIAFVFYMIIKLLKLDKKSQK